MAGVNIALTCKGEILSHPATLVLAKTGKGMEYSGFLHLKDAGIHSILKFVSEDLANIAGDYARRMLGTVTADITVRHTSQGNELVLVTSGITFAAKSAGNGSAILIRYTHKNQGDNSGLFYALDAVAGFFGMHTFLFYCRSGTGVAPGNVAGLLPKNVAGSSLVKSDKLSDYDIIAAGQLSAKPGESGFMDVMETIFGVRELSLFIAAKKNGSFETFFDLPSFNTDVLSGKNFAITVGVSGNTPSFAIAGDLIFSFLPAMPFKLKCALTPPNVSLEATAEPETSVDLIGPFKIGTTALTIGLKNKSLSFGMVSTLYAGTLALFGAIMLSTAPVKINLVALAIRQLSLPDLIRNICGVNVAALDFLGFIKLLGFNLNINQTFDKKILAERNISAVVSHFNKQMTVASFHLQADRVEIQNYPDGGLGLVDRNSLRCYFIGTDGKLSLQAQCYYSSVTTTIGPYSIQKGVFICGLIEIFGIRFKALFSFTEGSGVLAFAQIDPIKLGGFLELSDSKQKGFGGEEINLPNDSVLMQFMDKDRKGGPLFYLNAGKSSQTFYFSGRLVLLSFFEFDALVKYESGNIYIAATFPFLIFTANVKLQIKYNDFQSGGFMLYVSLDTSKLEEKLKAVTENINKAIDRIRAGANNAVRKLNDAQNSVNQLYNQINNLNSRIAGCREAIRKAKWYQFWIPVGKGLEIAGYEIAKVGIYAAIGIANAALEIAKGCVITGAKIGEGVLHIVNGIIKGITSLFFLKKIELSIMANSLDLRLGAKIEFVALGKNYSFETSYAKRAFNDKELSGSINGKMQNDLDNIEKGSFKTNFIRTSESEVSIGEHTRRLNAGMASLRSGHKLLDGMQDAYFGEFGEHPPSMEEINLYYIDCMNEVQASFETVRRLDVLEDVERLVEITAQDVEEDARDEATRNRVRGNITGFRKSLDELKAITSTIYDSMGEVDGMISQSRETMDSYADAVVENAVNSPVSPPPEGDMENVLDAVEQRLTEAFPANRQTGDLYIHLPREPVILDGLAEARRYYEVPPSETLSAMQSRFHRGPNYTARLR